jgi:membrane-bound metal-dependent hydrolase YbcI (DUF457 family)
MTGKTHRIGGVFCVLGGYTLLSANGMLLSGVNPLLQLGVMYPFAMYGAIVSDLDHHWESCPSKDLVSYGINKTLHLFNKVEDITEVVADGSLLDETFSFFSVKHRSWQTHSDLFLLVMIGLMFYLLTGEVTTADQVIIKLMFTGLILGIISHLALDMLTPEGVWCFAFMALKKLSKRFKGLRDKINLVPKTEFFSTGGRWEKIVRGVLWLSSFILAVPIILAMFGYKLKF